MSLLRYGVIAILLIVASGLLYFFTFYFKKNVVTDRNSVKVILINASNKLLLMSADDPKTTSKDGFYHGRFWFMIGGKIEDNEDLFTAASREIWEETGIARENIQFGPVVWYGSFEMILSGKLTRLNQQFIVARTTVEDVSMKNLTDEEKTVVQKLRWFDLQELRNWYEVIYPVGLAEYLEPILKNKYPSSPIWIDLSKKPKP